MLSSEQYNAKKEKVGIVVTTFLKGDYTIAEVAKLTGISSSSVQRYLTDEDFISLCFGSNTSAILDEIRKKLIINKQEGLSRGGINYSLNNEYTKDELGHFTGSRKK